MSDKNDETQSYEQFYKPLAIFAFVVGISLLLFLLLSPMSPVRTLVRGGKRKL